MKPIKESLMLWRYAPLFLVVLAAKHLEVTEGMRSASDQQGRALGFDTGDDYQIMRSLQEDHSIRDLSPEEVRLLTKYSARRGLPLEYVVQTLDNAQGDGVALKLVPIYENVERLVPDWPLVKEIPADWDRHGCHRGAVEIGFNPASSKGTRI